MRRFSLWLRGKPVVADAFLALALLLGDLLGAARVHNLLAYLVVAALLPLPVVWRRVYPRTMAGLMLGLALISTVVAHLTAETEPVHLSLLGLGIMLYTLVAYVGRLAGAVYVVGLITDGGLSLALLGTPAGLELAFGVMLYALCWILAEFIGARHAYDAEVAARLAVTEDDRARQAHAAVAAERTRIARELHDVVAHAVSVMIVQADGAGYALRRDPDTAERALGAIADTGREALRELRRTVALLRTDRMPAELPQHGTAGLAKMVEMMRGTGLAVELELTGRLEDIAAEVSLGVHRIVQEALTNTLRHAGAQPKAWVRVRRRDKDVVVEITDTGDAVVGGSGTANLGSGLGLAGMRERVTVLGGEMTAGRTRTGSWRVWARIPLTPPEGPVLVD